VLRLDVPDLDMPNQEARVRRKGGAIDVVVWQTGTARLLPRLLKGRCDPLSRRKFLPNRRSEEYSLDFSSGYRTLTPATMPVQPTRNRLDEITYAWLGQKPDRLRPGPRSGEARK
jgi:hypothetical protein